MSRYLAKQHPRKTISVFPSRKGDFAHVSDNERQRQAHYIESQLEADCAYLLEFEPAVLTYRTQPFRSEYTLHQKKRPYTPDFAVQARSGVIIIEVKYWEEAQDEALQLKHNALLHFYAKQGHRFRVLTERELRIGHQADNRRFLFKFLHQPILADEAGLYFSMLPPHPFTLAEAMEFADRADLPRDLVHRLIAQGYLSFNLSQPMVASATLEV